MSVWDHHNCNSNLTWNGTDTHQRSSANSYIPLDSGDDLQPAQSHGYSHIWVLWLYRIDCPREWGELIPTLLMTVKSEDELQQHRALLTLHHVIKALSSKRLVGDRRLFQELTVSVYSFMVSLWDSQTCLAISQVKQSYQLLECMLIQRIMWFFKYIKLNWILNWIVMC